MARSVKCPSCGLHFDRDLISFIHHKNRYYHKSCYDAMNEKDNRDRADLMALEEYIIKLLKLEYVDARIKKQLKTMMEEYGFTYSGIHKTLIYWYEVKKNSTNKANGGLGIVPYVYKDAAQYFYTIFMAQLQNKDTGVEEKAKQKIVKITPPKRQQKEMKIIDLDKLEEEFEDGK